MSRARFTAILSSRRRSGALRGLLTVVALATLLDVGCGWPLGPRPTAPPASCSMRLRLVDQPAMEPRTISTSRLVMAPFGYNIFGCSMPSTADALAAWERLVPEALAATCGAGAPETDRMRWCPGGAWCKIPGSSSCSANVMPTPPDVCTAVPSTPAIPDCPDLPPPVGAPRIDVTPNPVAFPLTMRGASRDQVVTVANVAAAGSRSLTVNQPTIATDAMSLGMFTIPARSCGPAMAGQPGTLLAPTQTCAITVRFAPSGGDGARRGELLVSWNDGAANATVRVPLSGIAGVGQLAVSGILPGDMVVADRLCFGGCLERSLTLTATGAGVPISFTVPMFYSLVAPTPLPTGATANFTVTPGMPLSLRFRTSTPPTATASFLTLNRRDGGPALRNVLFTAACALPAGCS